MICDVQWNYPLFASGLISYEEFLEKTKQPDFEKDPGWDSLDQKPVYTHEEYLEFERRRQEEVQRMIQQGLVRL